MKNTSAWLVWFTLLFASGAYAGERIDWNHWELDAFEAAKTNNKIILVNVGMEGCAACGRMEDVTYADSEVINIINEHFVAIEVDAEARPDIGERFSRTGYLGTGELTAEMARS